MSDNYRSSPFKQIAQSAMSKVSSDTTVTEEKKVETSSPLEHKSSPFGNREVKSASPFEKVASATAPNTEEEEMPSGLSAGLSRPSSSGESLGGGSSLGSLGGSSLGGTSLGGGSLGGGLGGSSLGGAFGSSLASSDSDRPAIAGGGIATNAGFRFTPMVTIAEAKKEEINPFAPRVEKTEEQIRQEEEKARIARENSFIENQPKSKLESFMDKLNQPLF